MKVTPYAFVPQTQKLELTQTFQLSRFDRETHGLGCHLTVYHTVNQKTLKLPKNSAKYEGKSNNLCS